VLCPFCGHIEDKVVDSREASQGASIRRRRECLECHRRFTTYERIETVPFQVVKRDGRREKFDRQKLLAGLFRACEKRALAAMSLEAIADEIEGIIQNSPDREVPTSTIGNIIMDRLKEMDQVAYVRFASVYRRFGDISEFIEEVKKLADPHRHGEG
jgi:transcriptional repressor NrdR